MCNTEEGEKTEGTVREVAKGKKEGRHERRLVGWLERAVGRAERGNNERKGQRTGEDGWVVDRAETGE